MSLLSKASDYATRPVEFFKDVLGIKTWEKQNQIARSIVNHKQTAVKSCFTAGKTYIAAALCLQYIYTHQPSILITTATTFRQVRHLLWREISRLHNRSKRPLGGNLLQTELKLDEEKWYGIGFSSSDPDNFRGFHEENILLVIDEAGGIEPPTWEAMENAMSSPNSKMLAIGNPTDPLMPFADCFRPGSGYNTVSISAYETPNVMAGKNVHPSLCAWDWPARMKKKWGENSPFYQYAVLGEFPTTTEDAIIGLKYVEAALDPGNDYPDGMPMSRYKGYYETIFGKNKVRPKFTGGVIHGMDIARYGNDCAAIARREKTDAEIGGRVRMLDKIGKGSLTSLAGKEIRHARRDNKRLEAIIVEAPGEGEGVIDILKENRKIKDRVMEYWPNAKPKDDKHFDSLKVETLFHMKEDFENGYVDLADEEHGEEIGQDLSQFRYDFTKKGQYTTEQKDEMKKRIGRSPDLGDATVASWVAPKKRSSMEVLFVDGKPPQPAPRELESFLLPSGKYSKNVRQHTDPETWTRLLAEGKIDPRG